MLIRKMSSLVLSVVVAAAAAGCASPSVRSDAATVHAAFYRPADDHGMSAGPAIRTDLRPNANTVSDVGSARKCRNSQSCALGVVKNTLQYSIQPVSGDAINVSGTLRSKVARSIESVAGIGGMRTQFIESIPDGAAFLGDSDVTIPFNTTLSRGQTYDIDGAYGSKVRLEVE